MDKSSNKYCKLVIFSQGYEKKYPLEIERLNSIDGVYAADDFRHHNLILRILRRIHILSKLPGINIWFGRWRNFLPECDTLICMTHQYSPYILCWVKKHYPNIKCINYFWDEVDVSGYPIVKTEDFENWSFCRWDCQKYGFYYNPQFYVNSIHLPDVEVEYDVVFVGADRNGQSKYRIDELNKCLKLFQKENLTSFIWFVSDIPDVPENIGRKRRLSENEYLLATAKAKAVLELVDPRTPWMTMRPLLALANGKKVITNNISIQEEKFYSKANVFISGYDSDEHLNEFIHSPFEKIPEDRLHYYEASEWIERFEK